MAKIEESLGMKVEGELNDFQIMEEKSDNEEDDTVHSTTSDSMNTLSTIPSNVLSPSRSPVCGNVAVNNSENVIIGNNTYFNGPVTIKQVLQHSGIENPSYEETEDDDQLPQQSQDDTEHKSIKKISIRNWHKVLILCIICVVLAVILVILSVILNNTTQEDATSSTISEEQIVTGDKSKYTKVVVWWHENINIIFITIIMMPLTLMCHIIILTLDGSGFNKSVVPAKSKHRRKRESDGIPDDNYSSVKPVDQASSLIIAPGHLRIVSRNDWLAQPPTGVLDKIRQPIPWVVIAHSATENCTTQSQCVLRVRVIQMFHVESRNWFDIGYNFLVAGDGSAYFGRGWDYIGAHTLGYNKYSIGIAFIGTFNQEPPPKKQLDACLKLLKRGVDSGKLAKDYKLFAHRQLASTLSPGDKLYDIIKEWPHFVKNDSDLLELIPKY